MSSDRNDNDAIERVDVERQQQHEATAASAVQQQQQQQTLPTTTAITASPTEPQQINTSSPQQQQQQPSLSSPSNHRNVGILSVATYFPKTYVSQEDLEVYDKVDSGKYTKGLMQDKMGFCTDLEDINSIALTVTKKLLDASGVALTDIGYLEVGTETILDKSKSVKSVLMDLFESSGNTDIEGVDTTNACYGGTAALFHAIDHCSTPHWDGRLAIVVTADIAVYDKGNARPTGGCGAVAMLIGPNAPLVMDPFRSTHMTHTYDFYKPDPLSEYPTVDGKLSLQAYITAVDKCYESYRKKHFKNKAYQNFVVAKASLLDQFDAILCHSPYCKLVRKAFARLLFNEYIVIRKSIDNIHELDRYSGFGQLPEADISMAYENWMKPIDKLSLEKVATQLSEPLYQTKTADSLFLSNQVGNMYTASLYSCLISYLTSKPAEQLADKPVLFFSYGSGSAASMFSARFSNNVAAIKKLIVGVEDVRSKLETRVKVTPDEFTAHLEHKRKTFAQPNRRPTGDPVDIEAGSSAAVDKYLFPGTFYLTSVDGMFRRKYDRFDVASPVEHNNNNEAECVLSKSTHYRVVDSEQASKQQVSV